MSLLECYYKDYDTDTVSVTSTVSSEAQADYDLDGVLAETRDEDTGEPLYLIKWLNYDIDQ
jgi:hypothetical protein